jgi:hypothetical protein
MSEAFASAEMLAAAVDDAFVGKRPWKESLRDYEQCRDNETASGFRLTLNAAALRPLQDHVRRYYEAASDQPEAVTRIIGALGDIIPVNDVFSADRIASVVGT